ncbi:MAG: response regulator transcription factor [Gemmatimonadota bacterium]
MPIRTLVVDDHSIMRAGIAAMIANEEDIVVVAEAADGAEAVAMYQLHHPDVVLMDLRMPKMDGVAATQAIHDADAKARIVALTTYDGDAEIYRALSAGDRQSTRLAWCVRQRHLRRWCGHVARLRQSCIACGCDK